MTNEQEALMGFYVHHLQEENRRLLGEIKRLAEVIADIKVVTTFDSKSKPETGCDAIKKAIHDAANVVGNLEGCHYEITRGDEDAVKWIEAAARTIMAYRGLRNMGMK